MISDARMRRDLLGRARTARWVIALSVATMIMQMLYEGAADFEVLGATYETRAWDVLNVLTSVTIFAEGLVLAIWSSAFLERVQMAWPGAAERLPSPHAMAWIVFLFPLTVFFPWLYLRRAAGIIGAGRARRLLSWFYGGTVCLSGLVVVLEAVDPYEVMPPVPAWWLGYTLLSWGSTIALTTLLLPMIDTATQRAMEGDVSEVFA